MYSKGLTDSLGIEIKILEKGFVTATMPVDDRTRQPLGYLHGGASVALAETVASVGAYLLIDQEMKHVLVWKLTQIMFVQKEKESLRQKGKSCIKAGPPKFGKSKSKMKRTN